MGRGGVWWGLKWIFPKSEYTVNFNKLNNISHCLWKRRLEDWRNYIFTERCKVCTQTLENWRNVILTEQCIKFALEAVEDWWNDILTELCKICTQTLEDWWNDILTEQCKVCTQTSKVRLPLTDEPPRLPIPSRPLTILKTTTEAQEEQSRVWRNTQVLAWPFPCRQPNQLHCTPFLPQLDNCDVNRVSGASQICLEMLFTSGTVRLHAPLINYVQNLALFCSFM